MRLSETAPHKKVESRDSRQNRKSRGGKVHEGNCGDLRRRLFEGSCLVEEIKGQSTEKKVTRKLLGVMQEKQRRSPLRHIELNSPIELCISDRSQKDGRSEEIINPRELGDSLRERWNVTAKQLKLCDFWGRNKREVGLLSPTTGPRGETNHKKLAFELLATGQK